MCGRYTGVSEYDLLEVVEYVDSLLKNRIKCPSSTHEFVTTPHFIDICPTNHAPIIVSTDKGITLTEKKWGYPGIEGNGVIINAKAETVLEKKMFAAGITRHRAVIPASGFYEWNSRKEKSTFNKFNESIMYMAGFYDHFQGGDGFMIITTKANDSMKSIHDRMPLIIETNQIQDWLTDDEAAKRILKQVPSELKRTCEYEQLSLF